ncbi:hypothetical protein [Spiroplasma culicicola]|uniref:Uncharacterized protein n=1 Tax=Spiroplasma culicicola AES-1 TaxID=1276246 RepID=W6AGH1_9MOLU|nr:hypothetical protein [Spiroplasma culicicola]AHI52774.1 hypothetical protein SCULI_v1c04330 [Spiroplasma culicicola AES-1]
MNLFIGIGNISNISELKIAKNNQPFVNATLWTTNIGAEKLQKQIMVMFQSFGNIAYELEHIKNDITKTDEFLVIGFANISSNFKGISIEKIIKINDKTDINNFFENELWKIL